MSLQNSVLDRKAKLAALKSKSLKRKAPEADTETATIQPGAPQIAILDTPSEAQHPSTTNENDEEEEEEEPTAASLILSGRNYDPTTRGAKLGFENNPAANADTLENRASALALAARAEEDAKEEKEAAATANGQPAGGIDLFQLRPKKANWDLKRELGERMRVLDVRTDNAIARLVRERIAAQGRQKGGKGAGALEGSDLAEAVKIREMQEREEERREKELEEEEEA